MVTLGTLSKTEWKSKSDKASRYEKCINCGEMVVDNWIIRHVRKCVEKLPNRDALIELADKNHKAFVYGSLSIVPNAEVLDAKTESLKNGYLSTHEAIAAEKNNPNIYKEALDEKLTTPTADDKTLLNNFQKYTFKFGDMVDAVVTSVESYGVHVNRINGNVDKQGLIKLSKARNALVSDLKQHFRVGDKIRAEVIEVRVDGKLGLSTKKTVLPNYPVEVFKNNSIVEQLTPIKEQIMATNDIDEKEDKHLEDILTFVKSKIGVVSPEAKAKIKELLATKGMFTFMLALAKVADFQMDVGLIYAGQIEQQMGNRP